jgi:short-subunit dehydrogenase
MDNPEPQLAVITGASTEIGFEFARLYAQDNFDLIIAADEPMIHSAARELGEMGVRCKAVQCDLTTPAHVRQLTAAIADRPVDALLAIAGLGCGKAVPDREPDAALKDIQSKIDGMVRLVFEVARGMRRRGKGRIIIIGSIAGLMPDIFQAVYNCSKAFLDSFSEALSNELKDAGVTVTCLMPCATESDFFAAGRASHVAKVGVDAMKKDNLKVVVGAGNRLHAAMHRGEWPGRKH